MALAQTPTLPDAYAFGEIQTPEPLLLLDARQLPAIEPEPIVLSSIYGPQAALPNKSTIQRVRDARGIWHYRLRLRWTFPGRIPALSWLPQVERSASHEPLPEPPGAINPEQIGERVRVGLAHAIRELRDERYLDAGQLAEDAEIPRWQLTAIEEARLDPIPFAAFSALASALGVKMSELLRRVEESSSEVQL
jgi:DNA-binding Xre family transcriptional regulator